MILVGQYDSPFVRRVGIALTLYGIAFEHRPWSVFGDADRLRELNPLCRVPTLVLDDGMVLVDSHSIIDHIDGLVPPGEALFPRVEPNRRAALRIAALATGLADKAVSLFYEERLHAAVSDAWVKRCTSQIVATLDTLETERARGGHPYWFGERLGHADIAVGACLRFLYDVHPDIVRTEGRPALEGYLAFLESLDVFRAIRQPFVPPT